MRLIGVYGLPGYETAWKHFRLHEEALRKRFSKRFLEDFAELPQRNALSAPVEAPFFSADPFLSVTPVGEGGLYGALWKACEDLGPKTGCRVDLLKVPVRQEVVEICELFEEDPYEVPSAGCLLVVWDADNYLSILEESVIIGKLTNDGRRVLEWDGMVRFLTPPQRQKIDIMDRKNEVHTC